MIYVIVVTSVVAILSAVTIWKARRVRNEADFLVAGRKLPWGVLVFTLLSSWIGAGSLFAGGENAYRNGFAALWQPAGGWIGLLIIWGIAGRARRFAQFTVPDLLEARYNATARVLGTIAIVIAYTTITSYQIKAGGDILHLIFPELSRQNGMYLIAAFVIAFTAGAGMASVAYLDLVIGALVTGVVITAFPVLLHGVGGWSEVRQALPDNHFQALGSINLRQALGFMFPTMLLLIGNQSMYQKFFSARSEKDAKYAVAGWIVGTLVLETLIVAIAVVGSAKFHPENPREIIPMSARLGLPAVLGALLLGGVFAKVISTANNYLFSPATNIIHDIYTRFIDRRATERRKLVVSRLVVILLGGYALAQAAYFESILGAALYAYTVYGAAVTPVVMAVFFWKRATTEGAIASIGLGTVVTVVWNVTGSPFGIDAIYPALGVSLSSLILVSLLTAAPPREKWEPFFEKA
ncbi:MAG TPA: sodium:solute symporter family protein [Bryobacteraceae bacterium]|nr:sodium:solute symporter family protein [Bryobacteraceae bacterium]HOQ46206.1 sodium:solute symporter family protein [Bryobacteraceae bacterium]HPQ15371.1 sodium:solute symporter family protein [Bryobacteraceae bacterium]HPU74011.1 sodium:solute symporter family protein [Bryobacteraceae bacterium]